MSIYIALFRGINVGGHNKLPMKELRTLLEKSGFKNVKTYIQSGNLVLQSDDKDKDRVAGEIQSLVSKQFGFEPKVMVLELEEMKKAINSNPFSKAESAPNKLHFYFLGAAPVAPNLEKIESFKKESERFELKDKVFYLHAPDGIGRSKLASNAEKLIGVPATARNWRTVQKIKEMADELSVIS